MLQKSSIRNYARVVTAPQGITLIAALLVSEAASARAPLGMPDPSLMPMAGAAAVIGVVAYRLKKRK